MATDERNGRDKKWTAVRLPRELKEQIERLITEYPELGYGSLADFVRDSIRRRIEDLKEIEVQSKNRGREAIEHSREIVEEIMGPEGLNVFDRKMQEAAGDMKNYDSKKTLLAMKKVLKEMMGERAERSISERIYERGVGKNDEE